LSDDSSRPEIRIDQLTGLRTLLAPARSDRPGNLKPPRSEPKGSAGDCPFCEGREDRTPPELDAIRPQGGDADGPGWLARTVPNLYPALSQDGEAGALPAETGLSSPADPLRAATRGAEPDLFASLPARGLHEVVIHGPAHNVSLTELGDRELEAVVEAWRARSGAHPEAAYVHLIVNEGPAAGASLEHSHAQLYALPFVPTVVARERERFSAYAERTQGGRLLQDIAAEEVRRRERLVAIDEEALLVCPWASRGPFELRLIPRQPAASFAEDASGTAMLRTALRTLAERFGEPPPLNLWVRTAPRGVEAFHWHIDILPRLTVRAGFEIGTGVEISTYAPEKAAAELRECLGGDA
jgi:UDPglucose--hexose-1-phosphate uridylyltransferase